MAEKKEMPKQDDKKETEEKDLNLPQAAEKKETQQNMIKNPFLKQTPLLKPTPKPQVAVIKKYESENDAKVAFGVKPELTNLKVDLPSVVINSNDASNSIASYIFNALKSLIKSNSDTLKSKQNNDIVADFTLNADVIPTNKMNNADNPHNCYMINVNVPVINTTAKTKPDSTLKLDSINDYSKNYHIIKIKKKKHDTCFGNLEKTRTGSLEDEEYGNNIASTFFDDISTVKPKK